MKTVEPWERQPGESAKAWEARHIYQQLGADRSLAEVGRRLGKSKVLMERWSRAWQWVERARAHDDDRDQLRARVEARRAEDDYRRELETQARRTREIFDMAFTPFVFVNNQFAIMAEEVKASGDRKASVDVMVGFARVYAQFYPQARQALADNLARLGMARPSAPAQDEPERVDDEAEDRAARAALLAFHSELNRTGHPEEKAG